MLDLAFVRGHGQEQLDDMLFRLKRIQRQARDRQLKRTHQVTETEEVRAWNVETGILHGIRAFGQQVIVPFQIGKNGVVHVEDFSLVFRYRVQNQIVVRLVAENRDQCALHLLRRVRTGTPLKKACDCSRMFTLDSVVVHLLSCFAK